MQMKEKSLHHHDCDFKHVFQTKASECKNWTNMLSDSSEPHGLIMPFKSSNPIMT